MWRLSPGLWWLLLWLLRAAAVHGEDAALSASRCKDLKEMDLIKNGKSGCYCYNQNSQIHWMHMWSTLQVSITSPGLLSIGYITERHNCRYPETILSVIRCIIHNLWAPRESNNITITINPSRETVCFTVKPIQKFVYTLNVTRNIVDFRLLLVFVAGIVLYFYAKTLSQSPVFYYSSGTVLGIVMTSVFILLLVKRYIPKYSTFLALMLGCWFASIYGMYILMEELQWLWYRNGIYILGYVLVVGFLSFAACYKRGPVVDARSRTLLQWTLRLLSLVLIYAGVAAPQFACAVSLLLLGSPSLPYILKILRYLKRRAKQCFTSKWPVAKHLTEEEYREQAEVETARGLEELRRACRQPNFPTWLAVSRLQDPKKFADFVLGSNHLSPKEVTLHDAQYGLGGVFLEEQLFNPHADRLPASQPHAGEDAGEDVHQGPAAGEITQNCSAGSRGGEDVPGRTAA